MLVVDTNVAVRACDGREGFELLGDEELVAPPLLWSEFTSLVHEAVWRREIDRRQGLRLLDRLDAGRLRRRDHRDLRRAAWRIADSLGLAKTYDAEFVALASLLDCRLVTLDSRLRRGAAGLGFVVGPADL